MAVRWSRWICAAGVLACQVSTTPAGAQGFLQNLFSWGSSSAPSKPPSSIAPPFGYTPYSTREPLYDPYRRDQRGTDTFRTLGGSYRTLCVRLCDGYYWPISQATNGAGMDRDATTCRSSCGQEARLFFHGSTSGDASEMIDLQGRPYVALSTAFRYRKKMVEGCRCKPEAWTASERERHRRYAPSAPAADRADDRSVAFSGPPVPLLPSDVRPLFDSHGVSLADGDRADPSDPGDRPLVEPDVRSPGVDGGVQRRQTIRGAPAAFKPIPPGPTQPAAPGVRAPVGRSGPLSGTSWPSG